MCVFSGSENFWDGHLLAKNIRCYSAIGFLPHLLGIRVVAPRRRSRHVTFKWAALVLTTYSVRAYAKRPAPGGVATYTQYKSVTPG